MKLWISILTFALILGFAPQSFAAGPTSVSGTISTSTEWTKDNSPYVIQSDVTIAPGATLTIDAGVEVQFAVPAGAKVGSTPNLVVRGGLRAIGNSTGWVSFTPQTAGSLWGAIYFYNSDPMNSVLQVSTIKGGRVVCNGSSPTISQCILFGAKSGVEIMGNSQPKIMANKITANSVGIALLDATANPVISNNDIYNNNYGFYLKDFGTPTVTGNRIYNNLKYNMVNYSAKTLLAPNNDFRIADAQQIMRTIYDGAYNPSLGRVNFMPFSGMAAGASTAQPAVASAGQGAVTQEKPEVNEEEFWSYGRPFDAMKISNVDNQKQKPSNTVKVLAVGATAVVTAVLLFL
ncbi:MAG TPA: right-handed parallel beta-helix repeat-containing protein [bacterium]|nr:right-handed parallel beta-helix repeat-containing protein [bacterium]